MRQMINAITIIIINGSDNSSKTINKSISYEKFINQLEDDLSVNNQNA